MSRLSRHTSILLQWRLGASTLIPYSTISSHSSSFPDHMGFIKEVAVTEPPMYLPQLLNMLQARGDSILSPGARYGIIPLAIPLAKSSSDAITALLRWPTAPHGMDMPVVEVHKHGVWLLAKNVDQFIHRKLVQEETNSSTEALNELFDALGDVADKLYRKGTFAESKISNIDDYLLRKVGLFPDVLERKVMEYLEKGDHVSALVTGEFYAKKRNFPGFARPFVFNAEVMQKLGRKLEAKDAARGALKSPWWTLGCKYQDVANIAEWDKEQITGVKKKITEWGREEDLMKGKPEAQIALDEAAFLLDLASVEGTWESSIERIAECYDKAGLHDIANFVKYRD